MNIQIANIITSIRILISIVLLFCKVFSFSFYILYFIGGFSDMIDGIIARKTNSVSEFGSMLDSIADLIFVMVCLIKLFPFVSISLWLYLWIAIIFLIRCLNIIYGLIANKRLLILHTFMNKMTGVMLFILPLIISFIPLKYTVFPVCMVATFAAIQEGYIIRKEKRS